MYQGEIDQSHICQKQRTPMECGISVIAIRDNFQWNGEIQRIRKWEIEKSIPISESQNKSNPDAEGGGLDLF